MSRFLSVHSGRCTHRQWIGELSLTKKSIADRLTAEMIRKTKAHYVANDQVERPQKVSKGENE